MTKEKRKASLAATFLGGYNDKKKNTVVLKFYETYVSFKPVFGKSTDIPYSEIDAVTVEAPEDTSKRVTATRLIATGVFALFLKKKVKEAYVVLELKDGQEAIFKIDGVTSHQVRAKLSSVIAQLKT